MAGSTGALCLGFVDFVLEQRGCYYGGTMAYGHHALLCYGNTVGHGGTVPSSIIGNVIGFYRGPLLGALWGHCGTSELTDLIE